MTAPEVTAREVFVLRLDREYRRRKAEVEACGGVYGLRTAARNIVDRSTPVGVVLEREKAVDSWRRHLQRYLRGQHLPTDRIVAQLAVEFGCAVSDLVGGDGVADEDAPLGRDLEAVLERAVREGVRFALREFRSVA